MTLLELYRKALRDVRDNSVPFTQTWGIANRALQKELPKTKLSKTAPKLNEVEVQLNIERAESLYNEIQEALQRHHSGHTEDDTPALLYEATDALALVMGGILSSLHKVSSEASMNLLRYYQDRLAIYVSNLQKPADEPNKLNS